jgi:hypothetical protein
VKIPLSAFRISHEEFVEERVEVDQAAIATQVVFGFAEERVPLPVRPDERQLLRLNQRFHHSHLQTKKTIMISHSNLLSDRRSCEKGEDRFFFLSEWFFFQFNFKISGKLKVSSNI